MTNIIMNMKSHSDQMSYPCEVCNKRFSRSWYLKMHMKIHTGERPHSCDICGKNFIQKGNLQKHYRQHTGDKPYICDICLKAFASSNHLRNHARVHSGEKPYPCKICGKSFSQEGNLYTHMKMHSGERPHLCKFCKKCFVRKHDLETHVRGMHLITKSYSCPYCTKVFNNMNSFVFHMKSAHSCMKPFKCEICCSNFDASSTFCKHISQHSHFENNLSFQRDKKTASLLASVNDVPTADITWKQTPELHTKENVNTTVDRSNQRHSSLLLGENSVKIFKEKGDHITIVINSEDTLASGNTDGVKHESHKLYSEGTDIPKSKVFHYKDSSVFSTSTENAVLTVGKKKDKLRKRRLRCSNCLRLFASKRSLNLHKSKKHPENTSIDFTQQCIQKVSDVQTHDFISISDNREKLHKYMISNKGFNLKANIERDMQLRLGERPFICVLCSQSFTQGYHLMMHMRTHPGEKPYICEVCKREFFQVGNLMDHMRMHNNETTYSCGMCDMSFALKNGLVAHERLHIHKSPLVCKICGKRFKRCFLLSRHMKVHTGDRPYKSSMCDKLFKHLSSQQRHLQSHVSNVALIDKELEKPDDIKIECVEDEVTDCIQIELEIDE
ncbi:hypothetical protein SK128_013584 [Halocaridina rubra]|uniref:C2H2-type domain-containing protein n=1 Tax=Halocaridina rubra TaxID=373956 RepID=A0AAN8WQD1_HALRR